MSSNQQYKEYNKRLKVKIRELEKGNKHLEIIKIALTNKLNYASNERIIKLERQLKQSKRRYQIILICLLAGMLMGIIIWT